MNCDESFRKRFLKIPTRDKHRSKLSKLPIKSAFARVRNRCIFTGRPRGVVECFRISRFSSRFFDGHKERVLVATTKPIEQGLALQLVYKRKVSRSITGRLRTENTT